MKHNLFLKTIQSPDLANVNRLGIPDTLKGRGENIQFCARKFLASTSNFTFTDLVIKI